MFNPNEPRDEQGRWTDFEAGAAIRNAASDKKISEAKTIQEAEKFALENGLAKDVNYKKLRDDELYIANNINNVLKDAKDQHSVTYDKVFISDSKSSIGNVYTNGANYYAGKLNKQTLSFNIATKRHVEEKMKINFDEWIVQNNAKGYWVGKTQHDLINHEIGHYLTDFETSADYNANKLVMKFSGVNISKYGRSSGHESLAEIWSKYKMEGKDSLKPEWIDFFNKYSRVKIK